MHFVFLSFCVSSYRFDSSLTARLVTNSLNVQSKVLQKQTINNILNFYVLVCLLNVLLTRLLTHSLTN